MFTRDIGSLFGGLPNRIEEPDAWRAVSNPNNPIRVWAYVSREGLQPWLTGESDRDANIHHWAWCVAMGGAYGTWASLINGMREIKQFRGDLPNTWSDIAIGHAGASLGAAFRLYGIHNVRHEWHFYMMRWLP